MEQGWMKDFKDLADYKRPDQIIQKLDEVGKKSDAGKPPVYRGFFQYFPRAIKAVSEVSKAGLEKYNLEYGDINWLQVKDGFGRYSDALLRHMLDEFIEGPTDKETDLLHLALGAWNAMARLEMFLRKEDK